MRAVREGLTVLVVATLLGYLAATFAVPLWAENIGPTNEAPEARSFMLGLLRDDPEALGRLRPSRDVASRALELKTATTAETRTLPLSLTYLGGGSQGPLRVDIYAVQLRVGEETRYFPLALTLLGGRVVRTE